MLESDIEAFVPFNGQEEADRRKILEYIEAKEKSGEDIFSRECEDMHFTASSWIVNEKTDKALFVYHNIYDSWSWTGGHADGEEDLLSVAIREAKEETGTGDVKAFMDDIFSIEIIAVQGHEKRGKYVPSHLHLNVTYLLVADENQSVYVCEDENSDVKWMKLEDIYDASSEKWMVDTVYRKLNAKLKGITK